jgi:epoxyqueuosine reductase
LGFIGRNGLLITPYGSFVHIGTLLLDKEVDNYDNACEKSCSKCNRCIECCPTHAIEEAYCVNANHCIAYQTIENKKPDFQLLKKEPWIYGCDICQDVCPENRNIPTNENLVSESSLLLQLNFEQLSQLSQTEFMHYFRDSGIKRRKHSIFMEIIKNKEQ